MLTHTQLAKVTEKNLENILRKAAEGKTLSERELAVLEEQTANQKQAEAVGDPSEVLTAEKFCQITNLTDRRHRQLAGEGYFPPPIKGNWQLTPCLQGMVKYLRELAEKNLEEMAAEKLKKAKADRKLAELKLSRERKESLDATSVIKAWSGILLTIRQKLLALPSKVSPRLAYVDEQPEVEEILEKEITEALVDLSKPVEYESETDDSANQIQNGDQGSVEAPETSAQA